jgi:hypothetical protein
MKNLSVRSSRSNLSRISFFISRISSAQCADDHASGWPACQHRRRSLSDPLPVIMIIVTHWLSGILTTWHILSYDVISSVYDPISHALTYGVIYLVIGWYFKIIWQVYTSIYFFQKVYDVIRRYRYITVYDGLWPSYVSIWRRFSTYTGHGYWYSWYKASYIWYMLAHPAQFCPRMLSWLVYACS